MVVEVGGSQVLLLYASQTGNAQAIAEDLCGQLKDAAIPVRISSCSERDAAAALSFATCFVLVASTTGDGDPPDSARRLWRQLQQWSGPPLSHLCYTVLGLGDTNYTNFCNFGKTVDKQLETLGAHRFYRCGWADDATGLEVVVEPWCEGLQGALKTHFSSQSMQGATSAGTPGSPHLGTQDTENGTHGRDGSEGVSRTDGDHEEPGSDQGRKVSLPEDNRDLQMALTTYNEEVVSKVVAQYNIDVLPQRAVEHLPLRRCVCPQDDSLSLPPVPAPYLTLTLTQDSQDLPAPVGPAALPAAASEVVDALVSKIRKLTHSSALKTTLEVTLELPQAALNYQPGDSIGVLVKNGREEVELLLGLLGLSQAADKRCELSVTPGTKKRAAAVPSFLPHTSCIRHFLEYYVDIRAVPKKPLLRALAEYTSEHLEHRRLLELVSREGAEEYACHVRQAGLSILDLLMFFRSCRPPITVLLEHLPRLLPRPYSVASSPLATPDTLTFAFNVVEIPLGCGVAFSRQGVCTGWLASLASGNGNDVEQNAAPTVNVRDLEQALNTLTLGSHGDVYISIYLRTNQGFRPPADPTTPVVMVGPGTGVTPFLGFLRHRQHIGVGTGEWWLFYGCRHKDRDFLYQNELLQLKEGGVLTHLIVSYSRDADSPRYVQDNILQYGASLALLMHKAVVYVCGDARNMAKDVFEAFVQVLSRHNKLRESEARRVLAKMQLEKRYLQDVWT